MAEEEELMRYLADIEQYPVLAADEELRLARTIEAGARARRLLEEEAPFLSNRQELEGLATEGGRAERSLVQSNLRLVVTTAREYAAAGVPILDIIQEGNLGLVHAVERFDSSKDRFPAFALPWIRRAIDVALGRSGSQS
jgi:DNA-directed RNA polymerase sigma subunit (sigma70/sigma32)